MLSSDISLQTKFPTCGERRPVPSAINCLFCQYALCWEGNVKASEKWGRFCYSNLLDSPAGHGWVLWCSRDSKRVITHQQHLEWRNRRHWMDLSARVRKRNRFLFKKIQCSFWTGGFACSVLDQIWAWQTTTHKHTNTHTDRRTWKNLSPLHHRPQRGN